MKNNKKGFTLIEMLIVIAVIAILVSMVIPVITGSNVKAAAATNAANLRSIEGQVTSGKVLGDFTIEDGAFAYTAENEILAVMGNIPAPNSEECCAVAADTPMRVRIEEDGSAVASYNGYRSDYFAYIAENGTAPDPYNMADSDKLLNETLDYANKLNTLSKELSPELKNLLKKYADLDIDQMAKDAGDLAMNINGQFNDEQASQLVDDMEKVNDFLDKYEVCKCEKGGLSCTPFSGCRHLHSKGYCGQLKSKD